MEGPQKCIYLKGHVSLITENPFLGGVYVLIFEISPNVQIDRGLWLSLKDNYKFLLHWPWFGVKPMASQNAHILLCI